MKEDAETKTTDNDQEEVPRKEPVIARSAATKQSEAEPTPNQQIASPSLAMTGTEKADDISVMEVLKRDNDRLKSALDDAVIAYRRMAVSTSPLYSDDIISGRSIEEIDASIKKVNGLVKKMRSSLEAELKELTIPAGAPERSAPDTSGLSPREKIKQGLEKK